MKPARLSKREAKEAFRALRLAEAEKQSRTASKTNIKRAKAALKGSGVSSPRRILRSLQLANEHLPDALAPASPTPSTTENAPRTQRHGLKKAQQTNGETGASRRKKAARTGSSDKQWSAPQHSGALGIAFAGLNPRLSEAVLQGFIARATPRNVVSVSAAEAPTDIVVHGCGIEPQILSAPDHPSIRPHARLHIYLERCDASDVGDHPGAANLQIANAAADQHGIVLQTGALIARYGQDKMTTPGGLSDVGVSIITSTILQIAADRHFLPPHFSQSAIEAVDILAARKLAESPLDLLSKLAWDSATPPKSISAKISRKAIEAFVEGDLHLPGREAPVRLGETTDWSVSLDDKRQRDSFYGLAFLSPVLTYWFAKANGGESEEIAAVDQYLKAAGVSASGLLARVGAVITDFANSCPPSTAPDAWEKGAVASRAKVLLLFLLCCRGAARRRIRFESPHCTRAFLSLLETLEFLRGPGLTPVASEEGIDHLAFVIGLALPLRRLPYGQNLLQHCFDGLARLQLDPGLTEDGVWYRGTFEQHCEVMRTLLGLVATTRGIKIPATANLTAALGKMTSFVESMLRAAELPPPIDHMALVAQGKLLHAARKAVSAQSVTRATATTHVFPQAGYFVSHSTPDHGAKSSQLAIHASVGSEVLHRLGRTGVGFCMGELELIVGGGVSSRKAPAAARAASRTDLATGNEYRVNGKSYSVAGSAAPQALSIENHCEGRGWAAAMMVCRAHANALIRRTAIHLKPVHAFIMVDLLESADGTNLEFEQFWHLGPDLSEAGDLVFAHAPGHFAAGFNAAGQFAVTVEKGSDENPIGWTLNKAQEASPNLYLRRTLRFARGVAVSAFQWSEGLAAVEVSGAALMPAGWSTQVTGRAFNVRFASDGLTLRRVDPEG